MINRWGSFAFIFKLKKTASAYSPLRSRNVCEISFSPFSASLDTHEGAILLNFTFMSSTFAGYNRIRRCHGGRVRIDCP